jgi:hypothetical protein
MPFQKQSLPPTIADSLPEAEKRIEAVACQQSCMYFLANYAYIQDPLLGKIRFDPWPVHQELINLITNNHRLVVLKARQVGVSWLIAGYALWRASFYDGTNVLMLSKREDEARKLLGKSFYIYQNLPLFLRRKQLKKNESEFIFADPQIPQTSIAAITAFPSTEDAGRSEAASDVICDEWAFHPYAEVNYGAYKPTIDAGGKLIGVSTANGVGNFFHRIYSGAKTPDPNWTKTNPIGSNGFVPIFIPWYARPSRNDRWYTEQVKEYADTPHLMAQEYPTTDTDAFISSGNTYFNKERINLWMQFCRGPIWHDLGGVIKKWKLPVFGEKYVIGADCAEGRGADLSGACVYHQRTMEHVADIHGDLDPNHFCYLVIQMAQEYNNALINIERNSVGLGIILDMLRVYLYTNIVKYRPPMQELKVRGRIERVEEYGWPTNQITRPMVIKDLATAINTGSISSPDNAFWEECITFINDNGKIQAAKGCRDDRVFKHALAIQAHKVFDQQDKQARENNQELILRGSI